MAHTIKHYMKNYTKKELAKLCQLSSRVIHHQNVLIKCDKKLLDMKDEIIKCQKEYLR